MTPTWRTREGEEILVTDLGDVHLSNILAMLRRLAPGRQAREVLEATSVASTLQGECATYCAESDIAALADMPVDEYLATRFPLYLPLVREAHKRGLGSVDDPAAISEMEAAQDYYAIVPRWA